MSELVIMVTEASGASASARAVRGNVSRETVTQESVRARLSPQTNIATFSNSTGHKGAVLTVIPPKILQAAKSQVYAKFAGGYR